MGDESDASEALAASNLIALGTTVATMQRLLSRRGDTGSLIPAEAAMIRLAVESARAEVRAVAEMLIALPNNPASTHPGRLANMFDAIGHIEVVLDVLAETNGMIDS